MINPIKILVIDDSEDDRELYRRALQKSQTINYSIAEADNGERGYALIEAEQPDCILLDYSMPGYDGVEILKRIRSTYPFIPVVMMTGQGNEKVAVIAMQEGAQNYISKATITSETLEHVIHMAIDHCVMEKRIHEQRTSLEIFTRALAHDLKEPVRTIRSFSEMIRDDETSLSERSTGYFLHIQNAAARMQMLIETVFLYTKLDDSGKITKEHCDIATVLSEVKENLSQLMQEHKTIITCASLPEVRANKMQLMQVLQNLISNAIVHNDGIVTVHISAEEQEDRWLIRIEDNGRGINETYLKKIFEPFKRLVHNEEGAGLGLAICHKIIESHGGKIWCESPEGKGTSFLFTIPKAPEELIEIASLTPPIVTAALPSDKRILANILLVDDRKADLDLIRIRLIEHPHLHCNLFIASNGEEALKRLHDTSIDLMLLDINMPEMDGFEVLEKMHEEQRKQTAVVMCTGSDYSKDRERAESLGVVGYLVKPGAFPLLKSMIDKITKLQLCVSNDGYTLFRLA